MKQFIEYIRNRSTGKLVLVLFLSTNVIYAAMLVYSIPLVNSYAPEMMLFDMLPTGYSFNQANELVENLGQEGRNAYKFIQLPIDFIYPLMFAVSYAMLMVWVLKQTVHRRSRLFGVAFLPVLAGLFDYLENFCILAMLQSYPDINADLVKISSLFTVAKSALTTFFFVFLLIAFLLLAMHKIKLHRDSRNVGG